MKIIFSFMITILLFIFNTITFASDLVVAKVKSIGNGSDDKDSRGNGSSGGGTSCNCA